jgi:hypothetical protein
MASNALKSSIKNITPPLVKTPLLETVSHAESRHIWRGNSLPCIREIVEQATSNEGLKSYHTPLSNQ